VLIVHYAIHRFPVFTIFYIPDMSCLPGKKARKGVILQGKAMDLFTMWKEVKRIGGCDQVGISKRWREVAEQMRNEFGTAGKATAVRVAYEKHIRDAEEALEDLEEQAVAKQAVSEWDAQELSGSPRVLATKAKQDDDEEEEENQHDLDYSTSTLFERLKDTMTFLLSVIHGYKRTLKELGATLDVVTRPLEDKVAEIRERALPGNKIVALGTNGIGKSFLFDSVLRLGCLHQIEYQLRNRNEDRPLEAVQAHMAALKMEAQSRSDTELESQVLHFVAIGSHRERPYAVL
jgi:hypothetical protein